MKKKLLILGIVGALCIGATGCEQAMTKHLGGSMTINLDPSQKLEEITWKDDSLWYLTRPMTEDDMAESHTFKELADFGKLEGTVTVVETKE